MKYAFGNPNVRFTKLAFLKHRFPNTTSSNAKSVFFIKDTRPAPLYLYAGPSRPAFLKHLYPDATIGNARAASLLSPTPQNLASQLCEARRTLAS